MKKNGMCQGCSWKHSYISVHTLHFFLSRCIFWKELCGTGFGSDIEAMQRQRQRRYYGYQMAHKAGDEQLKVNNKLAWLTQSKLPFKGQFPAGLKWRVLRHKVWFPYRIVLFCRALIYHQSARVQPQLSSSDMVLMVRLDLIRNCAGWTCFLNWKK